MKTICIIGAGPSGMAAALGCRSISNKLNIFLIDRNKYLGGILYQCIHTGFGLERFNEELTGPEYAERYIKEIENAKINILLESTVFKISDRKKVYILNQKDGLRVIKSDAIVFTMGCRERPRGAIHLPGTRPSGIFTAGLAQKLVNLDGYLPGKKIVILGSGDIGLIMARRLTLEGALVKGVIEIQKYPGGLPRNVVQCLYDYKIPLYLSHTITNLYGKDRVEQVTVSKVDENKIPIKGSEFNIDCDTLLLSIGLIPENELTETVGALIDSNTNGPIIDEFYQTSIRGFFSCGNVLHVHDIVDKVSNESFQTGQNAALYSLGKLKEISGISIHKGKNILYILPHRVTGINNTKFKFRVKEPIERGVLHFGNFQKAVRYLYPHSQCEVEIDRKYLNQEIRAEII